MARYGITTSNWNSPSFWSSINETEPGNALDFSALPSSYAITFGSQSITLSDGATSFTVGDATFAGSADVFLGGSTQLTMFDTLTGSGGNDALSGGAGNDTITGSAGADRLSGGDDADTFILKDGFGGDDITGGERGDDSDLIDLSGLSVGVTVYFSADEAGMISDERDKLSFDEIERFVLTEKGDSVDARENGLGVEIAAGAGQDTLIGSTGNDSLSGGDDRDYFFFSDGADTIDGGAGYDELNIAFASSGVTVIFDSSTSGSIANASGTTTFKNIGYLEAYDTFGVGGTDDLYDASGSSGAVHIQDNLGGVDKVTGSAFGDYLEFYAWGAVDSTGRKIDAAGGDDYIEVDGNASSILGGSGNDTIIYRGGDGRDASVINGGAGDDSIYGDDTAMRVLSGAGDDVVFGSDKDDTFVIEDGFGADTINGDEGDESAGDVLDLSAVTTGVSLTFSDIETGTLTDGRDTLSFSNIERFVLTDEADKVDAASLPLTTHLTIDGGGGDDDIQGHNAWDRTDILSGGAGNDSLRGWQGDDILFGGLGDDFLQGDSGADTLDGGQGNDTLTTWTGASSMSGGDDDDTFRLFDSAGGSFNGVTITGGEGGTDDDLVDLSSFSNGVTVEFKTNEIGTVTQTTNTFDFFEIERILLTDKADSTNVAAATDGTNVDGGDGNDTLIGGSGDDTLAGGDGNDSITGGDGNDYLTTGLGDDTLTGGLGNDTLLNSAGDDSLVGGAGDDSIVATGGNDTLLGGTGADTMEGGDDADTFIIEDNFGNDSITGGEGGIDRDTIDLSALTSGINAVFTASEEGTITSGSDTITFAEIEQIIATNLADTISAGAQSGIAGINVDAAAGDDTITGSNNADTISAGSGHDSVTGGFGADNIAGGIGDDTIFGDGGDDTLDGGDGADLLAGGDGNDTVLGGAGNDNLFGGDGDDTLSGGDNDDTISGDGDADILSGGAGNDLLLGEGLGPPLILLDFEDGASSVAADTSGNGRDGVYQGEASAGGTGWTGSGTALTLDGSGDYVEIPDDSAYAMDQGTISIRFNADTLTSGATLVSRDSDTFDGGGHIWVYLTSSGSVSVRLQSDSANYTVTSSSGLVSTDQWHNVAVTFGDDGLTLYVDGTEAASNAYTGGTTGNNEPWTLGASQMTSNDGVADNLRDFFDGQIDEFAVYDKQATSDEVQILYQQGVSSALAGNDTLSGDAGDDTLAGGGGDDHLIGGAGADRLEGGTGDDVLTGDHGSIQTLSLSLGGSERNGFNPQFEVYADGVLIYTGEVTWAQDGTNTFDPDAAGAFQSVLIPLPSGMPSSVEVRFINDTEAGDSGTPGDRNLHLDSITLGGTTYEAETDASVTGAAVGASDVNLFGTGSSATFDTSGAVPVSGGEGNDLFVYTPGDGADTITDFNTGNTGTLRDGDNTNNDFIDLSGYYDHLSELYADQADDGILNQSNTIDTRGNAVDYADNTQFGTGDSLTFQGASADQSSFTTENTGVVCFAAGTRIATRRGLVPVETLRLGDQVVTRDNGLKPIAWIRQNQVTALGKAAPICIKAGALGTNLPAQDLWVSRQHRLLLRSGALRDLLGTDEALVPAVKLCGLPGIDAVPSTKPITYIHFMCARHEIVLANGAPAETLYPGPNARSMMDADAWAELRQIFPRAYGPTARDILDGKSVKRLTALQSATGAPLHC